MMYAAIPRTHARRWWLWRVRARRMRALCPIRTCLHGQLFTPRLRACAQVDMDEGQFADNLNASDVRATAQLLAVNAARFSLGPMAAGGGWDDLEEPEKPSPPPAAAARQRRWRGRRATTQL